jgi:hypothetical protein
MHVNALPQITVEYIKYEYFIDRISANKMSTIWSKCEIRVKAITVSWISIDGSHPLPLPGLNII